MPVDFPDPNIMKQKISFRKISSARIIPLGFLLLIAAGTFLLMLPFATAPGHHTSLLTALFSSATAVCVTGLTVITTATQWTLFGKIVVVCLIQAGGMGIVSITAIVAVALRQKINLRSRVLIKDSFNLDSIRGLVRFLISVFRLVFLIEGIGAVLYAFVFIPEYGIARGIWYSVFHSVSAFCNAGIDIIGDNSLVPYQTNALILIVTMLLIIAGGLGYTVWFDLADKAKAVVQKKRFRISEQSRLVLLLTLFLIISCAAITFFLEFSNAQTIGKLSGPDKILSSLFQSVTYRTAGFSSVPQQDLREETAFIGCLYMFIGGSPIGTAGGVKTVTFFFLIASAVSYVRSREETVIFHRSVSSELIRKALAIVLVSFLTTIILAMLLVSTNRLHVIDGLYEIFSATATVGLSRGISPSLNAAGKIIDIIAMYLGRIGPISMALFFSASGYQKSDIHFAEGKFFVG